MHKILAPAAILALAVVLPTLAFGENFVCKETLDDPLHRPVKDCVCTNPTMAKQMNGSSSIICIDSDTNSVAFYDLKGPSSFGATLVADPNTPKEIGGGY